MLGNPELVVNVLYSKPVHVKDTSVHLDGEMFLQFKDIEISEYPPHLGKKAVKLKKGKHVLEVADTTFNLRKKESFDLTKRMWIDIIIHDDSISVHLLDKEPRYK